MAWFKELTNKNEEDNNGKDIHLKFWTPVSIALPPTNNIVLACTDHGVCDFLRFESGDIDNVKGQVWKDDDANLTIHGVICWAAPPDPFDPENVSYYEEDEEDDE